jgi:hypothetical protein
MLLGFTFGMIVIVNLGVCFVQCDCIVTQLYHDDFRLEYCSVFGPSFYRIVIKNA